MDFWQKNYELQVSSNELLFFHESLVTFYIRVTIYYCDELLFIARVTKNFMRTSYELRFIARVTS